MTAPAEKSPRELYEAMDERRRLLGLAWWQVAVAVDVPAQRLRLMFHGRCNEELRRAVEAWLEKTAGRIPDQPRKE